MPLKCRYIKREFGAKSLADDLLCQSVSEALKLVPKKSYTKMLLDVGMSALRDGKTYSFPKVWELASFQFISKNRQED